MFDETRNAPPSILNTSTNVMKTGHVQYVHTIGGNQPEAVTTDTPVKSSENSLDEHQQRILATYDKVGTFDTKQLKVEVLESGLDVLDKHKVLTKNQGRVITVGAHTSHGKSALLMQIAAHVAKTEPVIVHSFEMSTKEIETRLLAAVCSVPAAFIIDGSISDQKVKKAREDYAKRKLYVSNVQNRSLNFVMSSIYELSKVVGKPGLIVIDYAQQIKPGGEGLRKTERVIEITDISAGLLQLAQQLQCNIIIGAQLNNEVLKRAYGSKDEDGRMNYTPIISDVREGSSIAHDSALVLMVVRPYVFDRVSPKDSAHFYCLKHRGGELWDAPVRWDGSKTLFYEDK